MKYIYTSPLSKQNKLFLLMILCFLAASIKTEAQTAIALPDTILNVERIDEIKFKSSNFSITGSLYVPKNVNDKKIPAVIWVSGSGPSYRTIKSTETKKVVNCFLNAGFAYFRIDKPGYGDSKGSVNEDSLFAQLSNVVVDAVKRLKEVSFIDSKRIGVFGSSQAGYIMPLAITKCKEIAFMIGSSCPAENSIEQWNYLLEKQMVCEGYSKERAAESIKMFSTLRQTEDKNKFDESLSYFITHPLIVKSVNYDSSFTERAKKWWPREINLNDESHFNPADLLEKITIPVFMVYGEMDTQIDPLQAMDAYKKAMKKNGNPLFKIKMLAGVDHNMCTAKKGCLNEIAEMNKTNSYKVSPLYIETLNEWLKILKS
ncbi:MAG: CocE/NonD family hydrolase [Melioribacteraceae bacterium]